MMSQISSTRIAEEEEHLGSWPRRLYHIPTKTSYEWTEGNRYGKQGAEHKEPKYSILTYTWGRFKLDETLTEAVPDATAIPVSGISWNIPRIKPEHFTSDELLRVLEKTTVDNDAPRFDMPFDDSPIRVLPRRFDVEFVWVDVACLDQTRGSPTTDSEKGRQVAIFSKAKKAFAWLWKTTLLEMQWVDFAIEAFRGTLAEDESYEEFDFRTSNLLDILKRFFEDPWFTSLWTLQEAFLRSDAVFLSREAKVAQLVYDQPGGEYLNGKWDWTRGPIPPKYGHDSFTFEEFQHNGPYGESRGPFEMRRSRGPFAVSNIVNLCKEMTQWSGRNSHYHPTQAWQDLMALLGEVGIAQIATGHFFAVSIAAAKRKCKKPEDRVYGIQQLFQLRLGNTAVGKAGQTFTKDQLQDELTTTLLETHPALSQMHVFSEPIAFGNAWKMNESSVFPKMDLAKFIRIFNSRALRGEAIDSSEVLNFCKSDHEAEDSYMRKTFKVNGGFMKTWLDHTCQMKVVNISGAKWASFKGYTTPIASFVSTCYEEEKSLRNYEPLELRRSLPIPEGFSFRIFLDASCETLAGVDRDLVAESYNDKCGAYGLRGIDLGDMIGFSSLERHQKLVEQLMTTSNDADELIVLEMLAYFGDPFWHSHGQMLSRTRDCYWSNYGLLLQRKGGQGAHYRRLGYCYWEDYDSSKRRDRQPDEWSLCEGIFG